MSIEIPDGFSVLFDGAQHEVKTLPVDLVAAERHFGGDLETAPRMETVFWLCWNVMMRTGKTTDDFDTWLPKVTDIDIEAPIPLAPSSGS